MRKVAVFLVLGIVASLTIPALAQTPSAKWRAISPKLREVDSRLEKAFHDLRAAAALIEKRRTGSQLDATVDQALRSLAEGEQKLDQARAMVRAMRPGTANAAPPSRSQFEPVERLVSQAIELIRDAEHKIDVALKARPEDARKIGLMLKQADRHTDAAIKMLRQILASL